ncbi:conserved hypothetical protein [Gammaproteobacteria bacterium]
MTAITFDTLKFVERLEKAGVPREHAAAMAEAQKESLSEILDTQVATKGDLLKLEASLKNEIQRMDYKIQRMDYDIRLLKWMVGLAIAVSTATLALLARVALSLLH